MKREEVKKLTPQERVAGYLARSARITEIGARLRVKYGGDDTSWTAEEEAEWDAACDETDPWWEAMTPEEQAVTRQMAPLFGALGRGENMPWPELMLKPKDKPCST
jgi:hypothetical protein